MPDKIVVLYTNDEVGPVRLRREPSPPTSAWGRI